MTYQSAKVYTGSDWVSLAASISDATQRTILNITGTSYTPSISDAGKAIVCSNSSSITLTLPPESTTNFVIGQTFVLIQKGTGVVTVVAGSGVTLHSKSSYVKTAGQYSEARLIKTASNEWLLSGDLSA